MTLGESLHLPGLAAPWEPTGEWVPGSILVHAGGGGNSQTDPSLYLQSQDAGTYTCTAENPVGRARRRVHLTILALPVFTTLPGDRSLSLGDRLWLRCAARGSPTPHIGWTVNDWPVTGLGLLEGRWMGTWDPEVEEGRPVGTPQPSGEEVGFSRCFGFLVSRLGPVQTHMWP